MGNQVGTTVNTAVAKATKVRRRLKNVFDVFEGKMPQVLIIGLDGAGKTTLLYNSKLDETIFANVPPAGLNIEQVTPTRGATIQLYDLAGNKMMRHHWPYWYRKTEAIIFVVDAADMVRMDEAMYELTQLYKNRALRDVPIVVVANKQDVNGAVTKEELLEKFELDNISDREWSVFETTAEKGDGLKRVFKDVVTKIRHRREELKGIRRSARSASSSDPEKQDPSHVEDSEKGDNKQRNNGPSLFAPLLRKSANNDKTEDQKEMTADSNKSSENGSSGGSAVYDDLSGDVVESPREFQNNEACNESSADESDIKVNRESQSLTEAVDKRTGDFETNDLDDNDVGREQADSLSNSDEFMNEKSGNGAISSAINTEGLFKVSTTDTKYTTDTSDLEDVDDDRFVMSPVKNEENRNLAHQSVTVSELYDGEMDQQDDKENSISSIEDEPEGVHKEHTSGDVGADESDSSRYNDADHSDTDEENPDKIKDDRVQSDDSYTSYESDEDNADFVKASRAINVVETAVVPKTDIIMEDIEGDELMSEC